MDETSDPVSGWKSTLQNVLGDFGKVAASNLMKQTEALNNTNSMAPSPVARAASNGQLVWIVGGVAALVVLVVLLVKR